MANFEVHVHNLKDGSEHMTPFDDMVALNCWLRMHPMYRFGFLYRVDVFMDIDGKMQDIGDCLRLQVDNEALLKIIFKPYQPKAPPKHTGSRYKHV